MTTRKQLCAEDNYITGVRTWARAKGFSFFCANVGQIAMGGRRGRKKGGSNFPSDLFVFLRRVRRLFSFLRAAVSARRSYWLVKCEKLQRVLQFIILSNFPGSALSHGGNTEGRRLSGEGKKKGVHATSPCRYLNSFMKSQRQAASV